jgi:5-methyltetrahydropteroyltriglutamate--homocysteine methyltransferase
VGGGGGGCGVGESPQTIAARIKKALAAVSPEQLVLSTDCGMKPLARMVAKMKLHSLAEGAALVRKEVAGA